MKKLYFFLFALAATTSAFSQVIVACRKASGEINIIYDPSKNCPMADGGVSAKDTLAKRTAIGFHSGANVWSMLREWNSLAGAGGVTAITGKRVEGTSGATAKFSIVIPDPKAYYNAGATVISSISFVLNDGVATPASAWSYSGKPSNATNTGCDDFVITLATLATCAVGTSELQNMKTVIAPNPFKTETYITFNNFDNKIYTLTLIDAVGRVARVYSHITTDFVEIQRGNLTGGMYFVILKNAEGQSITQKLMAE
jgi:Secretion system C-terminal sorting domain